MLKKKKAQQLHNAIKAFVFFCQQHRGEAMNILT